MKENGNDLVSDAVAAQIVLLHIKDPVVLHNVGHLVNDGRLERLLGNVRPLIGPRIYEDTCSGCMI